MSGPRRLILPALAALVLGEFLLVDRAWGQRRAIRSVLVRAALDSRSQSNFLAQIFSPSGAAFRGSNSQFLRGRRSCHSLYMPRGPFAGYGFLNDGSLFDPYSVGTLDYGCSERGYGAFSNLPGGGVYASVNAVDMSAPAAWQSPGFSSYGGEDPGQALSVTGIQTGDYLPLAPQALGGGGSQPIDVRGTLTEALWQADKRRRESLTADTKEVVDRVWNAQRFDVSIVQPTAPIDQAIKAGSTAFRGGDYDRAREEFVQAMVMGCQDARVRLGLGLAEFARGRYEEAAGAIVAEMKRSPRLDRSALDVRHAYEKIEDFHAQLALLEEAASRSPGDRQLGLLIGYLKFYSGDRLGGITIWSRYLEMPDADPALKAFIRRATGIGL